MRSIVASAFVGMVIGLSAGHAVAQLPFRIYLFNGTELFRLFEHNDTIPEGYAYVAGVVDSITWISHGPTDGVGLFQRAGRCLQEENWPPSSDHRDRNHRRNSASCVSGLTTGRPLPAPAPH